MMIDDDIYGDLENFNDEENLNDLKAENGLLKDEVEILKLKIEDLTEENLLLEKKYTDYETKISTLLMTARSEVSRKDRLIADLNREKDELVFRNFNRRNGYTQQKRKCETPQHDDVKQEEVNDHVRDNEHPAISTTLNTEHLSHNITTSEDDKNCLQKLIIEMEEDNSSSRTKSSRINLNRRKSVCGYKVEDTFEDTKFDVRLNAVKQEISPAENITNSSKVETNRTKSRTTIEDNNIEEDNKFGVKNCMLSGNLSENHNNSSETENNEKKTVCDSTTDSYKGNNRNSRIIPKQEYDNSEISDKKKAFKIQRSRRQSMNEDIFRKRDFSPEQPPSIHRSRRDFYRDDFEKRRARNASGDRQRDLRVSRDNHGDSRISNHDHRPDPHISSYDRRPDQRIQTRISHRDPRNAARDSRHDQRNDTHESRRDTLHSSRERPRLSPQHRRERGRSTRDSERYNSNTSTRSHSKERYNDDTCSRNRRRETPTEIHKTSISTKRIEKPSSHIEKNITVDVKHSEDMANTLSIMYSDSDDEANSNQDCKERDTHKKNSYGFDLRQRLVNKISCPETNAAVKIENNDSNQCGLLDSRDDVYAYINSLSNQSTEQKSSTIDRGCLADSAPTFNLNQDYSRHLATSRDTPHSEDVGKHAPKRGSISFMEYTIQKIDDASSASTISSNISNTGVEAIFELMSSASVDPRQKNVTPQNVDIGSKEFLELSQNTCLKIDHNLLHQSNEMGRDNVTASTATSVHPLEDIPNRSIIEVPEQNGSKNEIINILVRKSPRKIISKYRIPKIGINVKDDKSEVSKPTKKSTCSDLKNEKSSTSKQEEKNSKMEHNKVAASKLETIRSKTPDKKTKESKKSIELQASQNTIANRESVLIQELDACIKDIKHSRKLTETSNKISKQESSHAKSVEAHKKRSNKKETTSSENKTSIKNKKGEKQSVVEITQQTNKNEKNGKEMDVNKQSNEKRRKSNESSENVSAHTDAHLLSQITAHKNQNEVSIPGENARESAGKNDNSKAEKSKLQKISENTNHTKWDRVAQNGDTTNSSIGETVNKRRKLYSHTDDSEYTSNTHQKLGNECNKGTNGDIKQEACPNITLKSEDNVYGTKDLKNQKSNRIKKKSRSVKILSNDMFEIESSNHSTVRNDLETNDKDVKVTVKCKAEPEIDALFEPNIDQNNIKEKESSLKSLHSKVDTLNTKPEDEKIEKPLQCLSELKCINERKEVPPVVSRKLKSAPSTLSQSSNSTAIDTKSIQSDESNYIIKINRKRKIVRTF